MTNGTNIEYIKSKINKLDYGKTIKVCRLEQLHVDKIEYKPTDRKADNY